MEIHLNEEETKMYKEAEKKKHGFFKDALVYIIRNKPIKSYVVVFNSDGAHISDEKQTLTVDTVEMVLGINDKNEFEFTEVK